MLSRLRLRLRALLSKAEMERELDEELRFHLEKETEQNLARGMGPEEARLAALRSFGGVERVKEESRDVRGVRFVEELWQDLRYGARMLLKQPGFTLIAVLTLALGIGANTAVFSIVNAVLLRPFPYEAPERLMILQEHYGAEPSSVSYPNFADWRDQNTVFDSMAAVRTNENFNLTGAGEPERLQGGPYRRPSSPRWESSRSWGATSSPKRTARARPRPRSSVTGSGAAGSARI